MVYFFAIKIKKAIILSPNENESTLYRKLKLKLN
jgi:hypothetical protein